MDNSDLLDAALKKYQQTELLKGLEQAFEHRYMRDPLEIEERKLSILTKKRQLGLPVSDSDYEDATNENESFYSHIMPGLRRRAFQAIPEPNFLGAKKPPVAPLFNIGKPAEDLVMLGGIPLGSAKNDVGILERIGKSIAHRL